METGINPACRGHLAPSFNNLPTIYTQCTDIVMKTFVDRSRDIQGPDSPDWLFTLVFFAGWWLAGQESPQSSSWILKQKHHLAKPIEFLRPRCGGGRGRCAFGPWSPPVKGADSFLQIQRGCCVHATCWHAELHRFKVDSTSHAGSGGRLHQMRIPLDK